MLAFNSPVEFYKREIELAQRHGIDGFALNAGQWLNVNKKTGETKPSNYVASGEAMYEAAKELNSGFKLFFSPDVNGLRDLDVNIGDMIKRFADHPNQLKHNGQSVISAWGGSPQVFAPALQKLEDAGTPVFFVPYVFHPKYSINWSVQAVKNFFTDQPQMDGIFNFAADMTAPEIIRTNRNARIATESLGKIFMAGATPAMNSPNLRDFRGMEGYCKMWRGIVQDNPDWVELVTWNDYNEDTNLMPYRWHYIPFRDRQYYDRDEAFLDLTAYFSAWYKSGVQPKITQDKLYFAYRNRSKHLTKAWDFQKKEWRDITSGPGIIDQIHDDVSDNVYATTMLTAPAELTISIGDKKQTFQMPAGIGHAALPMAPGTPRFTLRRAGKDVIAVSGRKQIIAKETEANSVHGYHLMNRTWTGAAAAGPATRLEAESGELAGGATKAGDGVQIAAQDGSSVTMPLKDLKTATYNIRITYKNPSAQDARLTLTADGASQEPKGHMPYYIPAFLPPTGNGTATTSVFWSLYDGSSLLKLQFMAPPSKNPEKEDPWAADSGAVWVDAIELVRVDPVAMPAPAKNAPAAVAIKASQPATPPDTGANPGDVAAEMVAIPGGTFQMGSNEGSPDEQPVHSVTLSPFAIGKYEITNAQYEKFDPKHKAFRDEYSAKDNDPVIYVSWREAAAYCNWLSTQHNLTPVYDEKTGEANLTASGYRLPTEAQWEYVASGRGENRTYPWGSEAPDATRGNINGAAALDMDRALRGEGSIGAEPVGSYPTGASRDGVMDLAGNVAEWCSDWYGTYSADAQTDPFNAAPSNYRALRGGSWGYYNYSQRVADREYNNPGYGGYIYIGFRVVLPKS
jgi:formylglycine-generating enzyme required for sulfatase activity